MIDPTALDDLLKATGGDPAFLAEMIDSYLVDTPKLIEAMHAALATMDATVLRRSAHALKSNSATFGASALASLCRDLEGHARDGAVDDAAALVARVEAEYRNVKLELDARRLKSEP